ncbi:efflux RND transporter periplasmic adaptor subunit [Cystobacter fuscus]|uniref:efflux RND transporter periplasmic adaptor subunit n=1 Tax=Cystobacter fuscus TaxID=43 RepID=UPI002B2D6779|nr:efflux RND transporter periplasmic adaptor subunit [Cystobacter fuscus]
MKKLVLAAGCVALALLCVGVLVRLRAGAPGEPVHAGPSRPLSREPGQPSAPPPVEGFTGVVVNRDTVDVAARVEGLVTEVRVRLGDRVTRNALLAQLDDHQAKSELEVARATLSVTRADEEKAVLEHQEAQERNGRNQKAASLRGDALSQEELAAARYQEQYAASRLSAARARVQEQQARVAQLEQRIHDEAIRAPFDGVVTARYVDPGASVSRGAPVVRLVSSEELWVRFAVPEEQGPGLATGLPVEVRIKELGLAIPGLVEKISPEVDAASRMIIAEARLTLPAAQQPPGLSGRAVRVHPAQHSTAQPTP